MSISNVSTPAKNPVNLRRAHFSDQRSMARVLSQAFWDDVLFGRLIHPHREQYPEDSDLYWLRRIQANWWDWSHVFVVTTDVDETTGSEVVTGVAHWSRIGKGEAKSGWLDPTTVALPVAKACTALAAWWTPNRAADPAHEDIIERSYGFLDHVWTGSHAESWYLEALGVHPDYQNRGLGCALVKWGLDQADREGVSASVISADGKERFYQRCGFGVEPIGRSGEGEGNPLSEVPGGLIFFKEARREKGSESET